MSTTIVRESKRFVRNSWDGNLGFPTEAQGGLYTLSASGKRQNDVPNSIIVEEVVAKIGRF